MDRDVGKKVEKANDYLKKNKVVWVQGQFVDIFGSLRSYSSPVDEYLTKDMWRTGISFDGSSTGFSQIDRSDLNLVPDPETLVVLPWTSGEQRTARVIVDIKEAQSWDPFEDSPREISKRTDQAVKDAGFSEVKISPELEFYIFSSMSDVILANDLWTSDSPKGLGNIRVLPEMLEDYSQPKYLLKPEHGYFASSPLDTTELFRNEFSSTLMKLGVPVKYHHHENGTSQQEVEFRAIPTATRAADTSVIFKYASRNVAARFGLLPTYMPKPLFSDAGNGMHIHSTLWKGKKPVFFDKDEPFSLSQTARYFIGGVMEHAQGMTAITNPTINSYRRLVIGAEAPVYISWSAMNRSALIRVPDHTDDPITVNVEVRHPDTSANPYLANSVVVQAGLDGIRKKIEPGDPTDANLYTMTPDQLKKDGIKALPSTLGAALEMMESDDLAKNVLGTGAYQTFLDQKIEEWKSFCTHVSPWEHFRYFDI